MKKFFLLFSIVLLIAAGYLIYLFGFKHYNVADANVDSITKEEYIIELTDGSKIVLDKNGNLIRHLEENDEAIRVEKFKKEKPYSVTSNSDKASSTSKDKKSSNTGIKNTNDESQTVKAKNATKVTEEVVTEQTIKKKYEPAIADIESQAYASLYNLIELAKDEYFLLEENDQKVSYPYFYNKYSLAASKLEARTDRVFYALMEIMEQDLKSNGLSTNLPDSLSSEYENRKNKLRRELLKKTAGL